MSDPLHGQPQPGGPVIDHEIDVRGIVKVGAWLAAVTIVGFLIAWGFYRVLSRGEKKLERPAPVVAGAALPERAPGPGLQATPEKELAAFRRTEQQQLESWGWIDHGAGVAHVPVEKAIDVVAAEGALPDLATPIGGARP